MSGVRRASIRFTNMQEMGALNRALEELHSPLACSFTRPHCCNSAFRSVLDWKNEWSALTFSSGFTNSEDAPSACRINLQQLSIVIPFVVWA